MSAPAPASDLLDLKLLPAWVKEAPGANDYSSFEGEEPNAGFAGRDSRGHDRGNRRTERPRGPRKGPGDRDHKRRPDQRRAGAENQHRAERQFKLPPEVTIRFLPRAGALENVIAQIQSGSVAYSVFSLARLFLEKPERYDVRITSIKDTPLFQLGQDGAAATERGLLESIAFAAQKENFYKIEVIQTEPIKGNFSNVARDRVSGTLLGPTNHHSYQTQLRHLYEQRYSRRMSFADFQRQIEIVSDPAAVEQWKEQARSLTTYSTLEEPPVILQSAAEAERHFRQKHLPDLIRAAAELVVDGVLSRRLPDRALGRVIEDAWAHETRSPSNMMQELSATLRQAGLNIFRHRRGMLFDSPVRLRLFKHELTAVSPSITAILAAIAATPGIHRKNLAEKLISAETAEAERAKMALASDLKWLVSEGYVIEFNDSSLDLPRAKAPTPEKPSETTPAHSSSEAAVAPRQTAAEHIVTIGSDAPNEPEPLALPAPETSAD